MFVTGELAIAFVHRTNIENREKDFTEALHPHTPLGFYQSYLIAENN